MSSILGVGCTFGAFVLVRWRIAKHRRDFPFVNDLRKVLNLEYHDFTRLGGDSFKTKVNDLFLLLRWNHPKFYEQLTPREQKCFAVCVAEVVTKRGLVSRSGIFGGGFGVCCMLNVGWPNELHLKAFEAQSSEIVAEAVQNWKSAMAAEKEYKQPLQRWPYYSPSKGEKLRVFCCCAKPSSADRWRPTDNNASNTLEGGVALTELKTREGTDEKDS